MNIKHNKLIFLRLKQDQCVHRTTEMWDNSQKLAQSAYQARFMGTTISVELTANQFIWLSNRGTIENITKWKKEKNDGKHEKKKEQIIYAKNITAKNKHYRNISCVSFCHNCVIMS